MGREQNNEGDSRSINARVGVRARNEGDSCSSNVGLVESEIMRMTVALVIGGRVALNTACYNPYYLCVL